MKANFYSDYTHYIAESLANLIVTRRDGTVIDADAGLLEWIRKVKHLRDVDNATLYLIGNGASATIAEHMALDAMKAGDIKTGSCSVTAYLTAISNDISPDDLFSYRLGKLFMPHDMLVTISSSGNSPNVLKAIETVRAKGGWIVTLSGMKPDNRSRKMGDLNFYVPSATYGTSEVCHADLMHCWLDAFLDEYAGGRR